MIVSYDTEALATYVRLSDEPVARTIEVSDLVHVDVDESGAPIGIEFVVPPAHIKQDMLIRVVDRYPDLRELLDIESWLSR